MERNSSTEALPPGASATSGAGTGTASAARTLVKTSAIYAAANFGTRALGIILLPLYTRFLSPADYGTITLAEIIASIVVTIATLGMDAALNRMYFHYPEGSAEQRDYVTSVLIFAFAVLGGVTAAALAWGPALERTWLPHFQVAFRPYIALAIGAAASVQAMQYAQTIFQSRVRAQSYARMAIALYFLTAAACVALVVGLGRGAAGMLEGKLAAGVLMAFVGVFTLRPWLGGKWSWKHVRESFPVSIPLMPHQLMALGLVIADRFLLEHYRTLNEVGLYSLAYTGGMAMYLIVNSVLLGWGPVFYQLARAGEPARVKLAHLNGALAWALAGFAAAGSLAAPAFVRLLDVRYHALAMLIPLVIVGYFFHGLFSLFHIAILQSRRSKFILYASSIALAANLALNLLWIPRWGMYGAAYATIAGYALEALAAYWFAQRLFALPYDFGRLALAVLFTLSVSAVMLLVPHTVLLDWIGAACALPVLYWVWREWNEIHAAEKNPEAFA